METKEDSLENGISLGNTIPPKFIPTETKNNRWIKSLLSLILFLTAGYFFFPDYNSLILITIVIMFHEMGHFLAMKYFKYNDVGIFFIPLLGAYVSGGKREVSQLQSAIILLAGPIPGAIVGIVLLLVHKSHPDIHFMGVSLDKAGLIFLLLNLLNLIPIYPLDGGQLLNRVYLDEESIGSKIFVIISALLMCFFVWFMYNRSHNPTTFILLFFPLSMLIRRMGDGKLDILEKKIEEAGININVDYKDLPDKDYWAIRNIAIQTLPQFKTISLAPPYEYADKEDKLMETVRSILHRNLIQDLSIAAKILILLIWLLALASPFLLNISVSYFSR